MFVESLGAGPRGAGRGLGRSLLALGICALALLFPARANAEKDLVGILSIDTSGVSGATAEQFETQVEEALSGVGRHSVSRAALRKRLEGSDFLEGCYFGPCLTALRVASGVPLILVARIQGEGSSYSFVITLVDTKTGVSTAQVAQTCPVCTVDEAIMTATLATIALLSTEPDVTVLAVDDALVEGAGPSKSSPTTPSIGPVRGAGWLFLATGIAAVAGGGYLLLEDERRDLSIAGLASGAALFTGGASILLFTSDF